MSAVAQHKYHCGEVFVTNNNYRVMLECKFCNKEFTAYDRFLNHIFDDHFDNIDNENFRNDSFEIDDMEVLKALENSEYTTDNDCYGITTEIIENTSIDEVVENSQSTEIAFTKGEKECDYAGNGGNLSTEISIITVEVDKQTTNDDDQCETVEQNSVLSNSYFRPVVIKYRKRRDGEERKHKCKFCDTTFADVFILRKHEQRHSNNKPFCCSKCPKRFFTRTELNTHIRWHTGERPFVCTYCGNCYTTNGALNTHEKRHIGKRKYKCDHCDKSFYEGVHLREHIVVHTRERKYTCDQCQSKFTRVKALRMHMKLHENALRYKCNICNMRFNQKPTLIWHEKSKHAIVRGGAVIGAAAGNIAVTKPANEIIDNDDAEYRCMCCDIEFGDKVLFLKHQNEMHATIDTIATFGALREGDNEYVDFI